MGGVEGGVVCILFSFCVTCTGVDLKKTFLDFYAFWVSGLIYQSLKIISSSTIAFLQSFHSLMFLLWRGSLRMCAFSLSHKIGPRAESLLFIFPRAVSWSVQARVPSPKPAETSLLLISMYYLQGFAHAICRSTCMPFMEAHVHCLRGTHAVPGLHWSFGGAAGKKFHGFCW